ncbi:hypothetical protein C8R44DRAFT_229652 [Mycena epipterygia]|nr:hypothetical protein C8R44DRAFT_229652 [Mycena epipterygia]
MAVDGSAFATPPSDLTINVAATTLVRHQKLLSTNEPHEGAELTFIRSVVSQNGARLAHLDDEIAQLRDRLRHLEDDERASLATYHSQNNDILSHVSSHWRAVGVSTPLIMVARCHQSLTANVRESIVSGQDTDPTRSDAQDSLLRRTRHGSSQSQIEMFRPLTEQSSRWSELLTCHVDFGSVSLARQPSVSPPIIAQLMDLVGRSPTPGRSGYH